MGQSAIGRAVGMAVIMTVIFFLIGIYKLIVHLLSLPKRKKDDKLLKQSKQVSPDGKVYCLYCKKFTDSENDKDCSFCAICGRQRGLSRK